MLAKLYETIYLLFLLFWALKYFSPYSGLRDNSDKLYHSNTNRVTIYSLFFILVLFIGLRPVDWAFVDTMYYDVVINQRGDAAYTYSTEVENLIFDNIMFYWAKFGWDLSLFFIFIATIYYGGIVIACKKLFPKDTIPAIIVYLTAFSSFSYATNGIKAGAAASIFLVALAYRDNLKICLPMLLLSWGFHHSMSFPIAAFIVTYIYHRPKYYFLFWLFCLAMSAAHVTTFQEIFEGYADEKGQEYLLTDGTDWKGRGGFRFDFIIYSAMPILMGYYVQRFIRKRDKMYDMLLTFYLLTNGIWMLCMYVNYNNRIAYLSWFVYPIVLIYPLLNIPIHQNRYRLFKKVAYMHMAFTILMVFVYYGLSTLL